MLQRIAAFEKLFMANAMKGTINPLAQPSAPMQFPGQEGQRMMSPGIGTPTSPNEAQGMIQVPEEMRRLLHAQMNGQPYPVPQQPYQSNSQVYRQQQIQQQQEMQNNRWSRNAPYIGKLMVGSLAGLMVLEAVTEQEQDPENPDGRGLLAIPVHLVRGVVSKMSVNVLGHHIAGAEILWSLRLLAVMYLLLWAFVPSLFATSGKAEKQTAKWRTNLQPAWLSSPIHDRQLAWLTAIQTVWVPKHNLLLEAAALLLKTAKLSIRNVIGVHGYQALTGLTEEQEQARVKAWDIALEAQLLGGDVEINRSRLLLALLASGTLPSTPLRLMLSALHIRVLLWELGTNPMQLGLVNVLAAKLARIRWDKARQLHLIMSHLGNTADSEELPEHLALLLEQRCDNVLNDSVIQRAHNLAWNYSTTHNSTEDVEGMDEVITDEKVRSPMDAVAAWWSSQMIQAALVQSLGAEHGDKTVERVVSGKLDLAIEAAPVGAYVHIRALVARAVAVSEKRGLNISAALQMASETRQPEVSNALLCAQDMAHLQRDRLYGLTKLQAAHLMPLQWNLKTMSLLEPTAAFKLMEQLLALHQQYSCAGSLIESLAAGLRVWIGGSSGDSTMLGQNLRRKMVERCLTVTKSVVGMEADPGYGSMSECEEDSNEC